MFWEILMEETSKKVMILYLQHEASYDPAYAAQSDRRCLSVYERQHLHIKKM